MTCPGVLVMLPTYDEYDNVAGVISRILASVPTADVLVIDDGSPDGTGKLVAEIAATQPSVHLLQRPGKQGLGVAYRAGYDWGLERGYGVFVQMDADGSHQPEQLPALLAGLEDADLVLGSRWVFGGAVINWPRRREVLSRAGNLYTRLMLGLPLKDSTGGYRALHRRTVELLDLRDVASAGYCFQVDVVRRALRSGCHVLEVPIEFVEREHGVSKMDGAIVREALWRVTVWGAQRQLVAARDVLSTVRRRTVTPADRGS